MKRLIAGAMSGTSADGVDVAVVLVSGRGIDMSVKLVAHHHGPYEPPLRDAIFAIRAGGKVHLADLARCTRDVSVAYANAVNDALFAAGINPQDVAAVAAHGQTAFHAAPNTLQLLDPSLVAAQTGCVVVSDFRRADCAAGGQGAPLVPFADFVLFRHPSHSRVLLNIGGIANLTFLPAGASLEDVLAFDTGPGNCVSDWLCRTRGPFAMEWDVDGAGASRGRVLPEVRDRVLAAPYFSAPPPKTTDSPAMTAVFDDAVAGANADLNDLLATAAFVTATTIASAVSALAGAAEERLEVIASGGGTRNDAIMSWLRSMLREGTSLRVTDDLMIPSGAKEAVAFALLAAATLDGLPSNVPSATGASRAVVLGSITPKP